MRFSDWAIVLATLAAPLFAIQVSQFLERRRNKRSEQLRVFTMLMATRASTLDPRHVESLNLIDVVFHGASNREIEIRRLWKQYLDHLNNAQYPKDAWGPKRQELLVDLLQSIATYLGFDFDKTHIKNQTYFPVGYGQIEEDQQQIRAAAVAILTGKKPLPVIVVDSRPQHERDT